MQMFTHDALYMSFRKGVRNGNWRKLCRLEKALLRASHWYSRVQWTILNEMLVGKLSLLVDKLKKTSGARVFKRGYEKAVVLLNKGEGIFAWAPSLKEWLLAWCRRFENWYLKRGFIRGNVFVPRRNE